MIGQGESSAHAADEADPDERVAHCPGVAVSGAPAQSSQGPQVLDGRTLLMTASNAPVTGLRSDAGRP